MTGSQGNRQKRVAIITASTVAEWLMKPLGRLLEKEKEFFFDKTTSIRSRVPQLTGGRLGSWKVDYKMFTLVANVTGRNA